MAISLNGVSGFSGGSYRTSTPRVTADAQVGAPPSMQQLGLNNEDYMEPTDTIQLQGTFSQSRVNTIEAPTAIAQLSEMQLPVHQISYARSAYEAASATQTISDAQKILG